MLSQHGFSVQTMGRLIIGARNVLIVTLVLSPAIYFISDYSVLFYEIDRLLTEIVFYHVFAIVFLELAIGVLRLKHPYEFFKKSAYELSGAFRYVTEERVGGDFLTTFKENIQKDRFEFIGSIDNELNAQMEVYFRRLEFEREAVLMIKTEIFSEEFLLEHMTIFRDYVSRQLGNPEWDKVKGLRILISVREMSLPLQVLLSARKMLERKQEALREVVHHQVYAVVEGESSVYANVHPDHLTREDRITWLEKYFVDFENPDHIWKDIRWKDMEPKFPQYKNVAMVVHKALNVWKGGYQEGHDKRDVDGSEQ